MRKPPQVIGRSKVIRKTSKPGCTTCPSEGKMLTSFGAGAIALSAARHLACGFMVSACTVSAPTTTGAVAAAG